MKADGGWTKGPWTATHDAEWCRVDISCDARADMIAIAEIETGFDEPLESEQIANARLIATAPELYEALELLLHDRTPWTVERARAALRKANGEQE